ncbi:MAG: nucleotidyltransferase [Crocinitomicaceae bacterium]|nr:nucleotidyltransferase [Crocinitomicaceae bacterium]|tara:strand:+ start:201 stop:1262 length:1062 start_codon:yes stop_codon:yes gene_type:complete
MDNQKRIIRDHTINSEDSLAQILQKLEAIEGAAYKKIVFVVDEENNCMGSITDGDVRRALMQNKSGSAGDIMNKSFIFLKDVHIGNDEFNEYIEEGIYIIPLISEDGKIADIIDLKVTRSNLKIDAFILAGGKGIRLRPLTENLPKPMLKVGDKPILEHNIDRLKKYGVKNVHISLNYLGDRITEFFGNGESKSLQINYVNEDKPLGTIGSMSLVDSFENDYVLVMNSDLLTDLDLEDFVNDAIKKGSDMQMATIPYSYSVPYAIVEGENGIISGLSEKPTYTYFANAGIYLVKTSLIELIAKNEKFDATDLVELLISQERKVTSYPIRSYWLDIGRMEDFKKAQEDINHIHL